jgi:hypothetical protein
MLAKSSLYSISDEKESGFGFRVLGSGLRFQGLGLRVQDFRFLVARVLGQGPHSGRRSFLRQRRLTKTCSSKSSCRRVLVQWRWKR